MKQVFALLSGLIFGVGLILSGMANPAKVQNFLDIAGTWDPSLLVVMGFAIAVTLPGFHYATRRGAPVYHPTFHLPTRRDLDTELIAGSALFGIGWGLGGLCPGPALTVVSTGVPGVVTFVLAMCAGLVLVSLWRLRRARTQMVS